LMVIPLRNAGGKTPAVTAVPTPNEFRESEIQRLMAAATDNTRRSQSALKTLIYIRDGFRCPLTRLPFLRADEECEDYAIESRCSHILPFSIHGNSRIQTLIEAYTGKKITARLIQDLINDPQNALNLQQDAHSSFDSFSWGIEAELQENTTDVYRYRFRSVAPKKVPQSIKLRDGDEIDFGRGKFPDDVRFPNPIFCNLKLAIARVLHASGAAEVLNRYDRDMEELKGYQLYLGGPYFSDKMLMQVIFDRLVVASV